jgi:protein-disulfide isomerase
VELAANAAGTSDRRRGENSGASWTTEQDQRNAMTIRNLLLAVAVAVVAVAGGIYYYISLPTDSAIPTGGTALAQSANDELLVAGPLGEITLGDPSAPVTVIEYASMTCSHCAHFNETTFQPFKEKYIDTGKVFFIFREYPLDPLATSAFMLARCLPKEQFMPFVETLFHTQSSWAFTDNPADALFNIAKQAGFTQETFKACLTNQQILDGVNWVKNRGADDFDVSATPTFFINGTKKSGALSLEEMDQEIGPLL